MRVLLFDNTGRRIQLFENTIASDFLWCLSRALSIPEQISSIEVLRDMDMHPRLRHFLEYTPGVKNGIATYSGEMLIRFLCNLNIIGVGFIQVLRGNEIIHFRRRTSALLATPAAIDSTTPEIVFSRGAPAADNSPSSRTNVPHRIG